MAPARTFPQKNGEKGLGHGRPVDSVLHGWRREVMEYAVFRLAMRSLAFIVAFAFCVSHLVRKRDFIDAVFRSPGEVRKSFTGRNDVLFLRVLNIVPSERRGVSVRDGETGEVVDLTVFSGYVDEGERLAVEYLPHTGYGAIVERG